jgi:hypothetical protein
MRPGQKGRGKGKGEREHQVHPRVFKNNTVETEDSEQHIIDALLVCFCNTMTEKHPHV